MAETLPPLTTGVERGPSPPLLSPAPASPPPSYLVMTVNDSPGINATALSETMQLKPSTVTRLVEKMETKGILTRKAVGKFTEVHPTDKSRALNMRLHEAWVNLYKRYVAVLGEAEANQLAGLAFQAAKALDG